MQENKIFFSKTREVKLPTRGTSESAGIDFFIPEFTQEFIDDIVSKNKDIMNSMPMTYELDKVIGIVLGPGERINIPSGIKVKMGKDRALIAHTKSGVGSKLGISFLASVVDQDYQGEIHLNVYNTSNENIVTLTPNMKLIQFLEIPIYLSDIIEVPENELYTEKTQRGEGGFGHTGN